MTDEPTEEGVWIEAGELRPSDVLDFRGLTEDGGIEGVPIARLRNRQDGVEVEVMLAGVPRYKVFAYTDRVCIRRRPEVRRLQLQTSKDTRRMIVTVVGPERTMLMDHTTDARPFYDEGTSVILEVAAPDDILVEDDFGELDWQEHGAYARLTVEEARAIGQALLRAADG